VKKPSTQHSAFTLVEVIIGVAILSIVMASITVLTIVSIQANQANVNRLTAYYLAQEGVEGLRNYRDSNWMQNYTWDKSFSGGTDYKIDYQSLSAPPWELTMLNNIDPDTTLLYLATDEYGRNYYTHQEEGEASKFHRYLHITRVANDDGGEEDIIEVTAIVEWEDHGRELDIQVSSLLTDWREGPI
jgi:prepilin-type N-terminal cleavage/methylation domain-containing protein